MRASTLAVVVNWNGWPWTRQCLADLAGNQPSLDVVVVDNGSRDESVAGLRALADANPRVRDVLLPANRGLAAAFNIGIRRASAEGYEHVWLLNNDVRVPAACHEALLAASSRSTAPTVWTPDLQSSDGTRQHVGGEWMSDGSLSRLLTSPEFAGATREGAWLTGTALFCAVPTALRIGAFDEAFFAYWEDVDWSLRATRNGVRLRCLDGLTVTHVGSVSSGGRGSALSSFLLARNELLLARKHAGRGNGRPAILRIVARQMRWAMVIERKAGREHVRPLLAGVVAGVLGRRGHPTLTTIPDWSARAVLRRPLAFARRLELVADRRMPRATASTPGVHVG